jgi:hypothetical protein
MSKFGFISDLEEDSKSPKQKFQLFEAEIGFEKASVLVPFDKADLFAKEAERVQPKSAVSLIKLAVKFGGHKQ